MTDIRCKACGWSPLGEDEPLVAAAMHETLLCPGLREGVIGVPAPPGPVGHPLRPVGVRGGDPVAPERGRGSRPSRSRVAPEPRPAA